LYLVYIITGVHKFSRNIGRHLKNLGARIETLGMLRSKDQNITKHCTKFSCQADLLPGICETLHAKDTIQKTYKTWSVELQTFEHL
jgi:hypothetical protein